MTPGADVQAIDALQDWYAALCTFRSEAVESLSCIALEIRRAFDWIDEEMKGWKKEAHDAEDAVHVAKQELSRKSMPDSTGRLPDTTVEEKNLARARARLEYAQDQVEVCRTWSARLPKMINEAYEGPARRLGNFLEADLPAAIADLGARIDRLHAYTATAPASVAPLPEAPS